ncbi:MAG TPA: LysR family transcriptional regulator [Candidatus Saccharimonadales bacterium]|nr:LysR family transcriptional regulator [Candidatus Saccharimonadales bacterium]
MEINQLRYFCAVASTGSFTKAAEQEDIAQPSLSQQIRKLEREIGSPLFERLGRHNRLTPYGEALLPQAQSILRQIAEAEACVTNLRQGVQGRLRIGVIPTILPYWLAPRLGEFTAQFPDVDLQLREATTQRLIESLQAGELDAAVASLPVQSPDIVCSELFRESLCLAVSPHHSFADADSARLKDLADERMLLLREGHCLRDNVLTACTRAKVEFVSVFETDQIASIFPLVSTGFGISLIPAMAAAHASGCKIVPLERGSFRRIGYLRANHHFVSKPMKEFFSWLRSLEHV